jgi:hypothetical protein
MCVIAYKPLNVAFPEEATLKNCWDNNPDMAGFMYAWNDHVYIWKGFEKFEDFTKALNKVREKTGDDIPFVMHFRISTQGFDKSCCQPFPLSGNMKNLKRLKVETNIGVAHNGIIDITSDGSKDYSDTMLFTTDYLVNIIRSFEWYKDPRTKKLIENLIVGSRLAILDKKGHCELMGKGWIEDKGCYYSNSTYSYKKTVYTGFNYNSGFCRGLWDDYYDEDDGAYYWDKNSRKWKWKGDSNKYHWDYDKRKWVENDTESSKLPTDTWSDFFLQDRGKYDFTEHYCPFTEEDDDSYCENCTNAKSCPYIWGCQQAVGNDN